MLNKNVNLINKLKFTIENHARITTSKNLKITTCQSPKLIKVLIAIDNDFKKIDFASGGGGNEESIRILKNLQPIDETLYFLISQIKNLINQIEQLSNKVNTNLKTQKFIPNLRDKFIDGRTFRVLQQTGIWKDLEKNDIKILVQGNDNNNNNNNNNNTLTDLQNQDDIDMIIPEQDDIDVDAIKNINAQI